MTKALPALIEVAQSFQEDEDLLKIIKWLQESTGTLKQVAFALMWRDREDNSPIDFTQVFRYYKGVPHQNAALRWLEQNSQAATLKEFLRRWEEWNAKKNKVKTLKLNVPYFNQLDNKFEAHRTCNTSSCAMVAKFLGAKISGDDDYYQLLTGDTTDHGVQTRALAELGIKSTYRLDLDFNDLDQSLQKGLPIVLGILHRGSLSSPGGGHMIVVIGRTAKQDYICHDPYGSLLDPGGGYTGPVENGNGVIYPRYILNRRWMPEGSGSGHGRLFYGNENAKPKS